MKTLDQRSIAAPLEAVYASASEVEAWPRLLPHYRWVRTLERRSDGGSLVEMAAWRPFGPARWPVWWVSEMHSDAVAKTIRYRHVRGITAGMDVIWQLVQTGTGTSVTIEHRWRGPDWPLVGPLAAQVIIGPVFIHGIATRTLAGLAAVLEPGSSRHAAFIGRRPEGPA